MIKSFLSRETFLWFANQVLDEVFGFLRDGLPFLAIEVVLALDNKPQDFLVIITAESGVAAQKSIEDASSGPQIALLVIVSSEDLW